MTDQANAVPKYPTMRVLVVSGGSTGDHIARMEEMLMRAGMEVTNVAMIDHDSVKVINRHPQPLDDGFAASYLQPVQQKPSFQSSKPYLKRKKGRS